MRNVLREFFTKIRNVLQGFFTKMRNVLQQVQNVRDIVNKRFTVFFKYNNICDIMIIRELTTY